MNYSQLNDETLVRLVGVGREDALAELFDRYNGLVFSIAVEFVHETALADHILQEVFLRVWQKADSYVLDRGSVKVWIASLTRHYAIDVLRKQDKRPEGHSVPLDLVDFSLRSYTISPEAEAQEALRLQQVREAMRDLPNEQRQALALAFFHGYSHTEIAQLLNVPLGTVKTRIRTALQKIRHTLELETDKDLDQSDD